MLLSMSGIRGETYAKTPERNVEAAEKARSVWPRAPCCTGPDGWSSVGLVLVALMAAPRSDLFFLDSDISINHG